MGRGPLLRLVCPSVTQKKSDNRSTSSIRSAYIPGISVHSTLLTESIELQKINQEAKASHLYSSPLSSLHRNRRVPSLRDEGEPRLSKINEETTLGTRIIRLIPPLLTVEIGVVLCAVRVRSFPLDRQGGLLVELGTTKGPSGASAILIDAISSERPWTCVRNRQILFVGREHAVGSVC